MSRAEILFTCGAAGVLLMSGALLPSGGEPAKKPRRVIPLMAARDGERAVPEERERLLGRWSGSGVTVIAPKFERALCTGSTRPIEQPPPNFRGYSSTSQVSVPRSGVELISKGASVTSSDPAPLGELSWITDGEKFGDDGYFVDLLPLRQWIQIDLGETREIWLIWTWMYFKSVVMYNDVAIRISDDPSFANARTVFNNDHDDSSGMGAGSDESWLETNMGHPVKVNGVRGRYVRLYSSGRSIDDTNQWIEVEVYGR